MGTECDIWSGVHKLFSTPENDAHYSGDSVKTNVTVRTPVEWGGACSEDTDKGGCRKIHTGVSVRDKSGIAMV